MKHYKQFKPSCWRIHCSFPGHAVLLGSTILKPLSSWFESHKAFPAAPVKSASQRNNCGTENCDLQLVWFPDKRWQSNDDSRPPLMCPTGLQVCPQDTGLRDLSECLLYYLLITSNHIQGITHLMKFEYQKSLVCPSLQETSRNVPAADVNPFASFDQLWSHSLFCRINHVTTSARNVTRLNITACNSMTSS
jgi:hypothetical protein